MTVHAMEEMAEDDLDILDVEHAILNGQIGEAGVTPEGSGTLSKGWP